MAAPSLPRHLVPTDQPQSPAHRRLLGFRSSCVDIEMSSSIPGCTASAEPLAFSPSTGGGQKLSQQPRFFSQQSQVTSQHADVSGGGVDPSLLSSAESLHVPAPVAAWSRSVAVPSPACRVPMLVVFTVPTLVVFAAVFVFAYYLIVGTATNSIRDTVVLLNNISAANIKRAADGFLLSKMVMLGSLQPVAGVVKRSALTTVMSTTLLDDNSLKS
eukprot:RCo039185